MECSVTLADPCLPDSPLIGCSEGFERLTGYSRSEVVGRNCRFLNSGAELDPTIRAQIREAAILGADFTGVLPNRRKGGEAFDNLFHMTTLYVAGCRYILGIQSDVTHARASGLEAGHAELVSKVAERIFSANFDACLQIEAHEFSVHVPAQYSQIMKQLAPDKFEAARSDFVQVRHRPLREGKHVIRCKNTFLEVQEQEDEERCPIRRSVSDSNVGQGSAQGSVRGSAPGSARGYAARGPTSSSASTADAPDFEAGSSTSSSEAPPSLGAGAGPAAEGAAPAGAPGGLASVGSAGHPLRCTECRFHFFSLQGCRSGADCRFCHELHPRKNPTKNNRLLRRFVPEEAAEPASPGGVQAVPPPPPPPPTAGGTGAGAPEPGGRAGLRRRAASVLQVQYACSSTAEPEEAPSLTAVLGQGVQLPARIRTLGIDAAERRALVQSLVFTARPPLPAGLSLDAGTGEICGVPAAVQERTVHRLSASTQARGPGGVALGAVAVWEGTLSLRVVDLRRYRACEAVDDCTEGGRELLTVKYVARGAEQ